MRIAAALFALALTSVQIGAQVTGAAATIRIIAVTVDGRAVPLARVRAFARGQEIALDSTPLATAVADEAGLAELSANDLDGAVLVVSSPGRQTTALSASAPDLRAILNAGREIAVHFEETTAPPPRVSWLAAGIAVRLSVGSTSEGVATIPGASVETTEIEIQRGHRAPQVTMVAAGDAVVNITPPAHAIVSGLVLDAFDRPVSGATMFLESVLSPHMPRYDSEETKTSADGRFSFDLTEPGEYDIEASADGRMPRVTRVMITTLRPVRLDIMRLRAGPEVTACFVDIASGEPVPNPRVSIEENDPRGFTLRSLSRPRTPTIGGKNGCATIRNLPGGVAKLVVDTPPYERSRFAEITVTDDEVIDLGTVPIGRGTTLKVHVSDVLQPASGMPVRIDRGTGIDPIHPLEATTNDAGDTAFARLGEGVYRLRAGGDQRPGGSGPLLQRWIDIPRGDRNFDLDLTLRRSNVSLQVVSPGRAVDRLAVSVVAEEPQVDSQTAVVDLPLQMGSKRMFNMPFRPVSRGLTDNGGALLLQDVYPGPSRVVLSLGHSKWSVPFEVTEAPSLATLTLAGVDVALRIVDREGDVVASATATWQSSSGPRIVAVQRDINGIWLDAVPTGAGQLAVSAQGFMPLTLTVRDPQAIPPEIEIKPAARGELVCRVTTEQGAPVKEAVVIIQPEAASGRTTVGITDDGGRVTIETPDAALGTVVVRRPGFASYVRRGLSLGSVRSSLTIALPPAVRVLVRVAEAGRGDANGRFRLEVSDEGGNVVNPGFDDMSTLAFEPGSIASVGPVAPGRYLFKLIGELGTSENRVTVSATGAEVSMKLPSAR